MEYVLAADGGATKTSVLVADLSGQEVGQGSAGPTSLATASVGAASFNLREAIRQATQQLPEGYVIKKAVMGLAGLDTEQEMVKSLEVFDPILKFFKIEDFKLVNDSLIALAGGTDNPNAAVLISGTGSICYGRNDQGASARVSGMDYLLADQGSAYYIGYRVIRHAVKSHDGRENKSQLEDLVAGHFRIPNISQLKDHVYNPPLTKNEIASLAKLCYQAHETGDETAKLILDQAVEQLAMMVTTVAKRLNLEDKRIDGVIAGSVMACEYVKTNLVLKLKTDLPRLTPVFPAKPNVYGALKMALKTQT
ncbi:MAG: BadF/BadG/BcrA/BcrD ATPase family protein [Patescibacteria group bacterium]